jgi:PEP-CTERM motif
VPSGRSYVQPYNNWTVQVTAVPEPSALAMTLVGFGLWVASRRRPTRHGASSTRSGAVI